MARLQFAHASIRAAIRQASTTTTAIRKQATKKPASNKPSSKFRATILLPRTDFPTRIAPGKQRQLHDKAEQQLPAFSQLYERQRQERTSSSEFILHDGPPYANGSPHIGHAVNKILKDITTRHRLLRGRRVRYVPGWDCHGLPIEAKALESTQSHSPMEIRRQCRRVAERSIDIQRDAFRSWGVMANWNAPYKTMEPRYEAACLRLFWEMFEKGLIYRALRPVYWSPASGSGLAEAELEYRSDHRSSAIFVRLLVTSGSGDKRRIFVPIWTTTPWSLPANQFVCYGDKIEYGLYRDDATCNDYYIVADELANRVSSECQQLRLRRISAVDRDDFKTMRYRHPVYGGVESDGMRFHESSHVSVDKGSGLVHSAPHHGNDDYAVAIMHGLELGDVGLVDEAGRFVAQAGAELANLVALDEGTEKVIAMLDERGDLLAVDRDFRHSYPYDWRAKTPVIVRASLQWFVATDKLKKRAAQLLESVTVKPERCKKHLQSMLEKRAFWNISRQRCWGVPIPEFYENESTTPIVDKELVEYLASAVEIHGSDIWWQWPIERLLPPSWREKGLERGTDILDIWFESGVSWAAVCGDDAAIADLYLEGTDQIGAWFQTSLLTHVALRDAAPYKNLFVHGFTVDGDGKKMSKSLGNVVEPSSISDRFGADVVRWLVAHHAAVPGANMHLSKGLVGESEDIMKRFRNYIRFMLGSIGGSLDLEAAAHWPDDLIAVDRHMLRRCEHFRVAVDQQYESMNFGAVVAELLRFSTATLSAFYFNAIKDRTYCDAFDSAERRSAVATLRRCLEVLLGALAPIAPHLVEEAYRYAGGTASFFLRPPVNALRLEKESEAEHAVEHAIALRDALNQNLDASTQRPYASQVEIFETSERDRSLLAHLHHAADDAGCTQLCDLLQVSDVFFTNHSDDDDDDFVTVGSTMKARLRPSRQSRCERCRKYNAATQPSADCLCERCRRVVCERRSLDEVSVAVS